MKNFFSNEAKAIAKGFKTNIHKKQYWVYALSVIIPIIVAVSNELGKSTDTNTLVILGNLLLGFLGLCGVFSVNPSNKDDGELNPEDIAKTAQELTNSLSNLKETLKSVDETVSTTTTTTIENSRVVVDSIKPSDKDAVVYLEKKDGE